MKHLLSLCLLLPLIATGSLAQDTTQTPEPVTTRNTLPNISAFTIQEIAGGFQFPLYVTHAGDGSGRLFVLEQTGRIWIVLDGQRLDTSFLDLSDRVNQQVLSGYSEGGLLGLAFHPDYAENGRLFINYTDQNGNTRITEYQVSDNNPNQAQHNSERLLLSIPQFAPNHNGGQMAFGPDGYLYIAVGDGGGAGDPQETGQDPSDLMGSILRINVDDYDSNRPYGIPEDNPYATNPQFAPEVWSYGLRNPWRFSFDRATGDLYIADVGQNTYEEVNFQPADSPGGENYGWDVFEGNEFYEGWMGASPVETITPIATYDHTSGCAITGGYVYRGAAIPELTAVYFFSDYCQGNYWAAYRESSSQWRYGILIRNDGQISSFGEDEAGELYSLDYKSGSLFKFVPAG